MKTVVLTGPESTGKTTLAKKLAEHYNGLWIPEYAREYVEKLDRDYTYEDVEAIARHQIEVLDILANKHKSDNSLVFLDTHLIITKVWFEYVYHKKPQWFDKALKTSKIDLYLLCKPDIKWEYDPVRENGDKREFFYQWYKKEIRQTQTPLAEISGEGADRLNHAVDAVDALFHL